MLTGRNLLFLYVTYVVAGLTCFFLPAFLSSAVSLIIDSFHDWRCANGAIASGRLGVGYALIYILSNFLIVPYLILSVLHAIPLVRSLSREWLTAQGFHTITSKLLKPLCFYSAIFGACGLLASAFLDASSQFCLTPGAIYVKNSVG